MVSAENLRGCPFRNAPGPAGSIVFLLATQVASHVSYPMVAFSYHGIELIFGMNWIFYWAP
jgi:hypothetical protein